MKPNSTPLAAVRQRELDPIAAEEHARILDHATIEELVSRRGLGYVLTVARNYAAEQAQS